MLISLTMPQFGESITQARIVHWLKKEGDSVKELEPIVEMETEKAVFAYESPFRGKLVKILEGDDAEAPVGKEIAQFEVSDQDGKKYLSLGIGKTTGADTKGTKLAPLIRSLAKEHGVSIEEAEKIPGSGPGGRVTKDDFLAFVKGRGASTSAASVPSQEGTTIIPVASIRARIADNMVLSKQKIPHAGCSLDVDIRRIETWRANQKKAPGYLPFAIVAAIAALKKQPIFNSSFKEGEGRRWIEQYDFIHLGIAVATTQGLMVPVIRNAQTMSFRDIESEITRLVEGGRKGTLKVEELTGATVTINNTGAVGVVHAMQIIPYPQAAIIAFNRVVRRPWVVEDRIEIRPVMSLDIAFDHRVADGAQAGRFLMEIASNLENFDFGLI